MRSLLDAGPVAVLPIMTHPGIELIGKCVLDAVTDGSVHADAVNALRKRFPYSVASTTIMDLSVEAEAFGAEVVFERNEVPTVTGRLLQCADDVEKLQIPSLETGRIPQYLTANRLASAQSDIPLLGGCIGPFSLAGRLYGMTELMMAMFLEPETAVKLLEKATAFLMEYVKAVKMCGSSGIIMAEPASGLLSNEDCYTYSTVYVKQIIDSVQDDGFAVVLHNCGNAGQCTDAMVRAGAAALHFGNSIDMKGVLAVVPSDTVVMGNIDPVGIMRMGTPEQIEAEVRRLLDISSGHDNFVLSTGCDVPPSTPAENIEAFFKAAGF